MEGYFKVHRKILNSQVFAHPTALKIWIWCLAKVTFKERFVPLKSGKGEITVKLTPGQFIFGRFKAEEELNIDGSTIYKWMQKFASDEFDMIRIESSNQYSIITICNWESYQNIDDDEVTTKEQPSNNQVAAKEQPKNTNKNVKNDKNVKNEKSLPDKPADFIDQIVNLFVKIHGSYEVLCIGKERAAAGKILKLYRKKYPNSTSEETIQGLEAYFRSCVNINDAWLKSNMSLPIIVDKFNSINDILRNGNTKSVKGPTTEQFAGFLAQKLGSDAR